MELAPVDDVPTTDAEAEAAEVSDSEDLPVFSSLPDFSDDDAPPPAPIASSSSSRTGGSNPPKSLPGRKKIPLALLKKKLAGGSSGGGEKDKKKELASAKPVQLSTDEMDEVMRKLVIEQGPEAANLDRKDIQDLIDQVGISKDLLQGKQGFMGKGAKDAGSHKFWSTQPVPKLGTPEDEIREGPLEPNKPMELIRQEPYDLSSEFRWVSLDLSNPKELTEVYELLTHHYVEDADATFRFDYSADFIEWALRPPGYVPDWHVGIRVAATNKLVAFISGIPMDIHVRAVTKRCAEINFLCVHKKLRSRRFTPLLIKEVTRRTHLRGIFQAIYTVGVLLPSPVSRCQYFHRSLNPKKLVETGFSSLPRHLTMARMVRQYKLPEVTAMKGLREAEKRDLKQIGRLLRAFLARMDLAPLVSNKEVEHALFAGRGKDVDGKRVGQVTWCYVVEDPETHRITDMFSFYTLPSTAVKIKPHTLINAAYLYYYATTACPSCADLGDGSVATPVVNWKDETPEQREVLKVRLQALVGDAMIIAQQSGFDVFNALTLQDNRLFLEDLKFGRGEYVVLSVPSTTQGTPADSTNHYSGFLHFYLYNYATKPILGGVDASDGGSGIGVVML
ncbi:hypothetical protein RQP46_005715 [Phenoliferia psychrophenolica]